MIINNEAALIGVASTPLGSSSVSARLAEVNAAMAALAKAAGIPTETVTLFDLSGFAEF